MINFCFSFAARNWIYFSLEPSFLFHPPFSFPKINVFASSMKVSKCPTTLRILQKVRSEIKTSEGERDGANNMLRVCKVRVGKTWKKSERHKIFFWRMKMKELEKKMFKSGRFLRFVLRAAFLSRQSISKERKKSLNGMCLCALLSDDDDWKETFWTQHRLKS